MRCSLLCLPVCLPASASHVQWLCLCRMPSPLLTAALTASCSYIHTAAYGHFGRSDRPDVFTWEKVLELKDA